MPGRSLMPASLPCLQCKAVFSRSAHLRRHQRTHRAEKPYVCEHCPVASSRKDVIVRHTRNFHPEAAPTNAPRRQRQKESPLTTRHSQDSTSPTPSPKPASILPSASQHAANTEAPPAHRSPQMETQINDMDTGTLENVLDFDLFDFSDTNPMFASPDQALPPCPPFLQQQSPRASLMDVNVSNDHQIQIPLSQPNQLPARSPVASSPKDAEYAKAQANLHLYASYQFCTSFQLPDKHAAHRFVDAFFRHMAPHMPIVHQPTFEMSSVASPLLIEIMACGALYICERPVAVVLHTAAQQLMFQIENVDESDNDDSRFELWRLQTYLLMSYFAAYGSSAYMQRATHAFSHAIKLAQNALKELDPCPTLTYKDWVYQESISRSIAHTIEIGAALAATARDQCFTAPFLDASFPLPSESTVWQQDEANWQRPSQQQDNCRVLGCLFAGQEPVATISELGLVTLVSSVLWRACSFEALAGFHEIGIHSDLAEKTDKAIRVLDAIMERRATANESLYSLRNPLIRSTKALLNSLFYHIYGSRTLAEMKRLLDSPDAQSGSVEDIVKLMEENRSSKLNIALTRAAENLQNECRLGVNYLKRMAPHQFGPICATACFEGGLLLSWYLRTKQSLFLAPDSSTALDQLIEEVLSELSAVHELGDGHQSTLPLVVSAELLSDTSVWQWPSAVAEKLKTLTKSSHNSSFHINIHM